MKKMCTKCKEEKDISEFSLQRKGVYRSRCNSCKNEDNRLYRLNNKEKDKKSKQNWKEKNSEYWSKYYDENKEDIKKHFSEYYNKNKKSIMDKSLKNYNENKDSVLLTRKNYYENNKDVILSKMKEYYINNKEMYKEYSIKSYRIKKIKFPHRFAWRSVLKNALKQMNTKKTDLTLNMLGYSANELKTHMENLFQDGMTWNNWGEWHIHHIKYVSHFNNNELPSVVNALNNLIPLWKEDHKNIHKNNA